MKKIVIDPGHGGRDPGAKGFGLLEKDLNLDIANRTVSALSRGWECDIIMTRTGDQTVSLDARSDLANKKKADYFLSIHCNASGGTGFESYIWDKLSNKHPTYDKQGVVHQIVYQQTLKTFNLKNRGRKKANFHVLRETFMSALLVETAFVDYKFDANLLRNDDFLNSIAASYAYGVALANALPKKKQPPEDKTLWIVQAGAFTKKENAEKRVEELKRHGIASFIKRGEKQ